VFLAIKVTDSSSTLPLCSRSLSKWSTFQCITSTNDGNLKTCPLCWKGSKLFYAAMFLQFFLMMTRKLVPYIPNKAWQIWCYRMPELENNLYYLHIMILYAYQDPISKLLSLPFVGEGVNWVKSKNNIRMNEPSSHKERGSRHPLWLLACWDLFWLILIGICQPQLHAFLSTAKATWFKLYFLKTAVSP
jgi:hypothetical protein